MCLVALTACAAVVAAAWYLGGRGAGQVSSVEALTTSRQDGGSSAETGDVSAAATAPGAADGASSSPDPSSVDITRSAPPQPSGDGASAAAPVPSIGPDARRSQASDGAGLSGSAPSSAPGSGAAAASTPAASLPVGLEESRRPQGRVASLPGAVERMPVRSVPVDQLDRLHRLGWNVAELHGLGQAMQADDAATAQAAGVRTVQVHHTDGEHTITVAETRPSDDSTELRPLAEKLDEILDLDAVDRESLTLPTGEDCTVYRSAAEGRWTAAVDAGSVQYVITSDLDASAVAAVADWVMTTDRSRVQQMPSSPDAGERLERGFRSLLGWMD
ncbi:hypothetical protein GCM10020260_02060 [Nesterenkonia halobia]|uniref:Uncharacterized protein n=2 Tax=Nesterenkonia halobia TaxID=37922 RepID=A0ABP6R843_9MICC